MSKATERALEAYPYSEAYTSNDIMYDGNFSNRLPYIEGYEQAEVDKDAEWSERIERFLTTEFVSKVGILHTQESILDIWKKFNEEENK